MTSQTARPPRRQQRPTRAAQAKKYTRQTAHVEARRDGKPLVFGWGGHLSRNEKNRLQRRAVWGTSILVAVLVVAVIIISWVNINVITPSQPITSVNKHPIPQSTYRKLVAVKAQIEANKINGVHGLKEQADNLQSQVNAQQTIITNLTKQISDTNKQLQALPAGPNIQRTNLTVQLDSYKQRLADAQKTHDDLAAQYQNMTQNNIPNETQLYTQTQVGNESVQWLQEDELIREWLANQSSSIQGRINPSDSAVTAAVNTFSANFPKSITYSTFLSNDGISDNDVHAMMTLIVRRQNMQTYEASLIKSPAYAVLARSMALKTPAAAKNVLNQLKSGADFAKIAKAQSVDTNKDQGGYIGWIVRGQYAQNQEGNVSAVLDNWLFDPSRKLNELSNVLTENGTYHILQILNVDPAYTVDATTLKSLQANALALWVLEQKALPGANITATDQTMLLDANNMPSSLPSSAPAVATPGTGLPPGNIPGQP